MIVYNEYRYPSIEELDTANPQVYGRLEEGVIVEYPVYDYHIVNRAHPFEWYVPVTYKKRPTTPPYHYVQERPTVAYDNASIIVEYTDPMPFGLEALFAAIPGNEQAALTPPGMPGMPEREPLPPITVDDADLQHRLFQAIKERVQQRLDSFAQSRDYFNILSAVSYEGSVTPKRDEEARYCKTVRDATWDALYALQEGITAGTVSFPHNWYEVEQHLPALQWPDTTTDGGAA